MVRVQTQEGGDQFAAVRVLSTTSARVAFASPVDLHLAAWRRTALATVFLLASTVALLAGAGGLYAIDVRRKLRRVREERARRARVDLALNRGRCGLWTWDLERGRIQWSASMFDLLELDERPGHWTIADLQALVHPEDESLEAIARAAAERRGGCLDVEFRMRAADGRWVWLRKRAEIVEDEETGAASLVGIAFDVTERKREAELSATADQRLRDAIEAISEAFVLWDSGGRLVLCNSKCQSLHNLAGDARPPLTTGQRRLAARRSSPARPWAPCARAPIAVIRAPTRRASRTGDGCRSTSAGRATAAMSRSAPTSPRSKSMRSSS